MENKGVSLGEVVGIVKAIPGSAAAAAIAAQTAAEDVLESIPADYSGLSAGVAPTFSSSTAYKKDDHVFYNNTHYRFTADHAAGAWTGTDAVAAVVGAEIAALKSDIVDIHDNKDNFGYYGTFANGGMASGVVNHDYNNRVTSDQLFEFDHNITVTPKDGFRWYYSYLVNGTYINSGWITTERTIYAGTKFKVLIARVNENATSYTENIYEFVSAITFDDETERRLEKLETYDDSADKFLTRAIEPAEIISGKILNGDGDIVSGNEPDKLYVYKVKNGSTIAVRNIANDSTRHVCGYLDGEYIKTFSGASGVTQFTFDCTGIDEIRMSLFYNLYDTVITEYTNYSSFTDDALNYVSDKRKTDDSIGNYLPSAINFGNPANWDSGYIKANGTTIESSASYKHSDYIAVYGGIEIEAKLLCGAEGRAVHYYDSSKNWIGYLATGFGTIATLTFTTPKETAYIRTTVTNTPANFPNTKIYYTRGDIDRNYFVNDLVTGWYNQANKSISTLFAKATAKPILTLIDDDTPTVAAVTRYHDACVANAVVGCYAVITKQLASQTGLADLLLEYEQDGFQSLIHCHNQGSCYDTSSAEYDAAEAESDFVQAIHEILPYNFANWRYWCTPFGSCNAALISIAKKWGMKCLIRSGMLDYETTVPHPGGKYQISRMSLNQNDAALTAIESALDGAALVNGWVVVATHMSENGWDSAESQQRFTDMIAYAKNLGFEIKTVAEALEIREPIYNLYATF